MKRVIKAVICLITLAVWVVPIHAASSQTETKPIQEEIKPYGPRPIELNKLVLAPANKEVAKPANPTPPKRNSGRDYPATPRPSFNEREIGKSLLAEYGWEDQWEALDTLWGKESGWQAGRLNSSSFACGIPQALPCSKIYSNFNQMEQVWINRKLFLANPDAEKEIRWGLNYIKARYKTPYQALQFHKQNNWY